MNTAWIEPSAQVVASVAAAVAAGASLKALRNIERARKSDAREALLDSLQATLLALRMYAPNYPSTQRELKIEQSKLIIERERLSLADRKELPSVLALARAAVVTGEIAAAALTELAILRGRHNE